MRTYVVAKFDSSDHPKVVGLAGRLEGLFADEIRDEERSGPDGRPCAGIKAIRALKGNVFTKDDVESLDDYARVLVERRAERIGRVEAERDAIERDGPSLAAYDFLIQGMRNGMDDVRQQLQDFMDATANAWGRA